MKPGGNSGVYLQNRYEIQVLDGDKTKHGMGAVINETESPYDAYNGVGKWNAYDIVFRAARFKDGKLVEKPHGDDVFQRQEGRTRTRRSTRSGAARTPASMAATTAAGHHRHARRLKLQCEGHDVRYRNAWIRKIDLAKADTNF